MLTFELIAAGYFVALALVAPLISTSWRSVGRVVLIAIVLVAMVFVTARIMSPFARGWLAHLYLVMAYWTPALLVEGRLPGTLEQWLERTDAAWMRGVTFPAWLETILEISYLGCYLMVPLAFLIVWTNGYEPAIDQFWTATLGAGCLCYGSLPWLITTPPRLRDTRVPRSSAIHNVNLLVLGRMSHGLNTFPSGHVAVSVAAALMVGTISPWIGGALAAMALAIAGGAVVGRYHYLADVLFGATVGSTTSALSYCCSTL